MPHHPHRPARRWHAALLALAMITCTAPALAAIPAAERQVLIDLYNGTAGDGWRDRTGWKTAGTFSAPGTSEGVVRLRVTLIAPAAQTTRLRGQHTIVVRKPAPSADAAA